MTTAPSISYSITVRLEVASHGRAVSEIARAVEARGGIVTALDVSAGRNERLRVDVTCDAPDAAQITDDMLIAAAQALANVVSPDEIGPHYIIPSVFHPDVTSSVAAAVRDAATADPDR